MKIETKFDIGDNVCVLWNNEVVYDTIHVIEILIPEKDETIITYSLGYTDAPEDKCFKTKEELIESL